MENKMNIGAKTTLGICLVIVCLLIATLFIPGCSNSETENSATVPQSTADTTVSEQNATEKPIENTIITKESAKKIAISHAGAKDEKVERFRSELDYEDGKQVYEIEFDYDGFEYDYEIDAVTGDILKFDKDTA